jgi:hypothetical protein
MKPHTPKIESVPSVNVCRSNTIRREEEDAEQVSAKEAQERIQIAEEAQAHFCKVLLGTLNEYSERWSEAFRVCPA